MPGVDVNAKNGDGTTALHEAVMYGRDDAIQDLLVFCAETIDINARDNEGRTAADIAIEKGHSDTFQLLVRNGCEYNSDLIEYEYEEDVTDTSESQK